MNIFEQIQKKLNDNSITPEQCNAVISALFNRMLNNRRNNINIPFLIKIRYKKKERSFLPQVKKRKRNN